MKLISYFLLILLFLIPIDSIYAENPPEFWIKNMEGKRFRSSKQNSPYVISFFFVNCPPCKKEIPMLHQFMSTNYPGIPVLFIDPIKSDSKKDIKKWLKKRVMISLKNLKIKKFECLLLHDANSLLSKNGDEIYKSINNIKTNAFTNKIGISIYDFNISYI